MIFSTTKANLMEFLSLVNPLLPAHSTKPITECVLLDLKENILKITATDLTVTLVSDIEVNGVEDGVVAIHGKRLFSIIKELPEATISIKQENSVVKIICGSIKFEVVITEDFSDYPTIPQKIDSNKIVMDSLKLKKYLSKTIYAVSNDELRAVLTGVMFSIKYNELIMVATDGVRLVRLEDKSLKFEGDDAELVIPAKSLQIVSNSIAKNEECQIYFQDTYAEFRFAHLTIFTRLISGKYPAYQAIIPVNNNINVKMDREIFINSLRRISISCNPLTRLLKLSFQAGQLTISSEDNTTSSKSEEVLKIDYTHEDMVIGFNSGKLTELVKNQESNFIELFIGTPAKPVIFKPYESGESYDLISILMPVKTVD